MELLSQINALKEKQQKGVIFREEERNMAEIISKCSSSLYKSRLIDVLVLERENWSYHILKSLIYDPDEEVAEKAVGFSDSVLRAYDIIARFTSIETDQHRRAMEQSRKQKRRITLKEMEEWPLEKLYSFDTFLEMTILRRIEEPENFMLRNTAWDEEKF